MNVYSVIFKIGVRPLCTYIYLLLAECEVRTASYGPSFFPSFYGPSAKREGHENKEGKNEDP